MENTFTAHNDLEHMLVAAQKGEIDSNDLMQELLQSQLFMPVEDEPDRIQGFQRATSANPLVLQAEDGINVMILFTSPERARGFLVDYPEYRGGLLTEFTWILERIGSGIALSVNPGLEYGIDLDTDTVEQLIHLNSVKKSDMPM